MLERLFNRFAQAAAHALDSLVSLLKITARGFGRTRLPARQQPVCSVLGNGPSLTESLTQHLDFIRQTEVICVNNFAHAAVFTTLRPQGYVISDPNYFVFTADNTNRPDIRQTLAVFLTSVDWPMTLYVPDFAKGSYLIGELERGNPRIEVVFFNYTVVRGFRGLRHWLYRTGLGMPQSQTVIVAALALMINRQFETIYVFGADTSWHEQIRLNEQNQLLMQQLHFYERPSDVRPEVVYADKHQRSTFGMASMFLSLHKVFKGYEVLRHYADERGVTILNASAKSYIDAFTRASPAQ
jgi:hypothetical protein